MTNHIAELNKVTQGWVEVENGMLINEDTLDIIDIALATKKWFFISNAGNEEEHDTRENAIEAYIALNSK